MASGIIIGPRKYFFWTVDSHVGPSCPNVKEDVELVQLCIYCHARSKNRSKSYTAAEVQALMEVVPGAPYSGTSGEALTRAIRAHQRVRGGTQDGRVSPVQHSSGMYVGGKMWMILALCNNIRDVYPHAWPRISLAPNCPPALTAACYRTFDDLS